MLIEADGSIRIAWLADGYEAVLVRAPFRTREELADYARGIADEALFERTVASLRVALRARYPGAFDLVTSAPLRTAFGAYRGTRVRIGRLRRGDAGRPTGAVDD